MKYILSLVIALILLWVYSLSPKAGTLPLENTHVLKNKDALKMAAINSCQHDALLAIDIQNIRIKYHHSYQQYLKNIAKYAKDKRSYKQQLIMGTWVYKHFTEKDSLRKVYSTMFRGCLAVQKKALERFYRNDQQKSKHKRHSKKTINGGDRGWTLHPRVKPDSKYYNPKEKLWHL